VADGTVAGVRVIGQKNVAFFNGAVVTLLKAPEE